MGKSKRFKDIKAPKLFLKELQKQNNDKRAQFGHGSSQERAAAATLFGAREMLSRCEDEIEKHRAAVALLCRTISDWIHRDHDDEALEHILHEVLDEIPAARAIMNYRDELNFANNKIKELETELERRLKRNVDDN